MTLLDAVINDVPSWGYLPMLTVAFSASMLLAGRGLRLCATLLTKARRPDLGWAHAAERMRSRGEAG